MAKRNGPPYRRMLVTYWNDPDVKRVLSLEEKAVFAYLFTNQHSHPCGLYRLPPMYVMDELGIGPDRWRELVDGPLATFVSYDWRTEEIFVRAMAEHQFDGGLNGKDRRIPWVSTQLQLIQSEVLLAAFADRYRDWNLPWNQILPAPPTTTRGDPHNHATKQGASQGASDGAYEGASDAPSVGVDPGPERVGSGVDPGNGSTTPKSKGHTKGHRMPDPVPDPVDRPSELLPPAQSAEDAFPGRARDPAGSRQEGELIVQAPGAERDPHPELGALWDAEVRGAVVSVWHRGQERIEVHGHTVGLGLEYRMANDLLHETDDPAFVRWLLVDAPATLGWDTEPRSLRWALRVQNLDQARTEYAKRLPPVTAGVEVKRPPGVDRSSEPGGQARAQRQIEQLREAQG